MVYPGRFGERAPALRGIADDWSAVPMGTWNLASAPQTLRGRMLRLWREGRIGFGPDTGEAFARLVDRWRVDVIHTNTVIIDAAARFAERAHVPHSWHIRERIGDDGFIRFAEPPEQVARRIAELSATVPVISEYVREVFARAGVGASTRLVHDGLDVASVCDPGAQARAEALRGRWGVPPGAPVVGMVGGLATPVKRHDVFLRAAARIAADRPDARFVVAGVTPVARARVRTGEDDYAARVMALVEEHGLAERTIFTGFVDDMPAVWAAMDIYVHACEVEGFSRAILEAMAAAVPVVAVASGGNPEAIRDAETGWLFPAGNDGDCAETVVRLLADPALARVTGKRAAREIAERFTPEAHYRMMESIFAETAARTEEVS